MTSATSLRGAMGLLAGVDVAGGLLAVATGVNTWGEAWSSQALLAAPWPMIAGQLVLTWLATRTERRRAAIPAGLLSAACLVSATSGFFDGGLANSRLTPALVAFQVVLLAVTAAVGALAARRAIVVLRPDAGRTA